MQKKSSGASERNYTPTHQITVNNCSGQKILTNRKHWFIKIFIDFMPSKPIFLHMDKNGNRHISEGEKKYGNPTLHLWGKAARTWKKEIEDLAGKELLWAIKIANDMLKDPFVGYPSHIKSELTRKNKQGPVLSIDRSVESAKLGDLSGLKEIKVKINAADSQVQKFKKRYDNKKSA